MEKTIQSVCKIAIVGPESTGKSELAQALANHFNEPWVPEYAREYLHHFKGKYTLNDIENIAAKQLILENEKLQSATRFLFCDTSLLVTKIWASFVFNKVPNSITNAYQPNDYCLHLLCDIDLEWQYDPLREHPTQRVELFNLYKQELISSKANYCIISGSGNTRNNNAINAINAIVKI